VDRIFSEVHMSFTAPDIIGRRLFDISGRMVGRVVAFYRYPATLDAAWGTAAVTCGHMFSSTHLVDLHDARLAGDTVIVAYPLETIKEAPNHQAIIGDLLSDEHGAEVLTHYRGVSQLV
jgi:hypothetical protein